MKAVQEQTGGAGDAGGKQTVPKAKTHAKTLRHFLFGSSTSFKVSDFFFFQKYFEDSAQKSRQRFSSSNSTNYKVKPSGVKVRLAFSSNFKINLKLGPRTKNKHDKTSSFMMVSKVPKILISGRRHHSSLIQAIDESLFDDVTGQRFDLRVFHVSFFASV